MDKHNRDHKKEEKKTVIKNPQHKADKSSDDKAKAKKA